MPEKKGKARIQGNLLSGKVYNVNLTLLADRGEAVTALVLAFVPDSQSFELDPLPATLIGFHGCVERFLFAVDPTNREVLFG